MPRPKVRPENRQRSPKACLPCQSAKIRCDAQSPCMPCLRRDRAAVCTYNECNKRRMQRALRERPVRFVSRANPEASSNTPPRPRRSKSSSTTSQNVSTHAEAPLPASPSVQSPERTESRLLLSSKGEKVYVGETSALSFLQFLRLIMKHYMGPSSFTENGRLNIMLEADTNEDRDDCLKETLEEKRDLIYTYFEASSGFLDLFDKNDILRLLQIESSPQKRRISKEELAILYLVIAIGGQCRGSDSTDHQYAVKYFSKGQQLAFEGMLRDPSIHMVRIFLLMTFYMLGACHRNAAYMYLGVASKAAATLGLHITKQYEGLLEEEYLVRWRVFRSLRVFDLVVSTPLGRPASSLSLDNEKFIWKGGTHPGGEAISAAFTGAALLEDIVQQLKKMNNDFDSATAEYFLKRLRQWIHSLPRELRQFAVDDTTAPVIRETAIGSIHVSCIYYFAIILTTRSFLISHLTTRLKEQSILIPDRPGHSPTARLETDAKTSQLANVCIQAGAYMANMCETAMLSGLLLRNMCLVKAWVFAAGLILGFSLFVYDDTESRSEAESAFQSARHVLQNLAELSPQAKHYDEILTSFADAIVKHRQQILSDRQKAASRYIDCVLDIDRAPNRSPSSRREGAQASEDGVGYYYAVYDQTPQPAVQPSARLAGGSFDNDLIPSAEADTDDMVDLDGFSGFSFQDGANWSIEYEPFGLLLDGL